MASSLGQAFVDSVVERPQAFRVLQIFRNLGFRVF